jgi:hypothetical protein
VRFDKRLVSEGGGARGGEVRSASGTESMHAARVMLSTRRVVTQSEKEAASEASAPSPAALWALPGCAAYGSSVACPSRGALAALGQ